MGENEETRVDTYLFVIMIWRFAVGVRHGVFGIFGRTDDDRTEPREERQGATR